MGDGQVFGPAGRQLWNAVTTVYELAPGEAALLGQACQTADLIDWMTTELSAETMTVKGGHGQLQSHPLLTAIAAQRHVLVVILDALALSMPDSREASGWQPVRLVGKDAS
jgi:hypothetical protein